MRKIVILLLAFSLLIFASSCTNYRHGLEKDKKDIIVRNKEGVIEFQGETYYQLKDNIFATYSVADKENRYANFILISWSYNFPFTGVIEYYSYSLESPNFIVEPNVENTIWFKSSFDYQTEIFVVENTEIEVIFSSAFKSDKINTAPTKDSVQTFFWYAKSYPSLRTQVNIFSIDGIYYLQIPNMDEIYRISDDFLSLLIANEVILAD